MARALLLVVLVIASALVSACGAETPTQPNVEGPRITSITPDTLAAHETPQLLTIRGQQFQSSLIFQTVGPDGTTNSYSGPALESLTSTSFLVRAVLPKAGTYTFTVRSGTIGDSNSIQVAVGGPGEDPAISGITPTSLTRSSQSQFLSFQGSRFETGLTVAVIEPDGATVTLTPFGVVAGGGTTFQVVHVFNKVGTYTLRVTNPAGDTSNTVSLIVNP